MEKSNLFRLDWQDLARGAVMAILAGVALPILAILQTPDFNVLSVNWNSVLVLAVNGGLTGLAAYLVKNFFSDQEGRVLGKV